MARKERRTMRNYNEKNDNKKRSNMLTVNIFWPNGNSSATTEEVGKKIVEQLIGLDFEYGNFSVNYDAIPDTITVDAHLDHIEEASSYQKIANALNAALNDIYNHTPFEMSIPEFDDHMSSLYSRDTYENLYEAALGKLLPDGVINTIAEMALEHYITEDQLKELTEWFEAKKKAIVPSVPVDAEQQPKATCCNNIPIQTVITTNGQFSYDKLTEFANSFKGAVKLNFQTTVGESPSCNNNCCNSYVWTPDSTLIPTNLSSAVNNITINTNAPTYSDKALNELVDSANGPVVINITKTVVK